VRQLLRCKFRLILDHELKFHREWKITGTEFALSPDPEELKQRRKIEETQRFRDQIYRQLEREGKYLNATKEGLVLQSSV
jgi:hypothetical protein